VIAADTLATAPCWLLGSLFQLAKRPFCARDAPGVTILGPIKGFFPKVFSLPTLDFYQLVEQAELVT
jgi:hypothetical protein